jgi:hypothetical protein
VSCEINLGAGLGFGPRDRAFLAVPAVAAAAATPGSQIRARFDGIPRRDKLGRWGSLVGLFIRGTLQYDTVDATMPTSMPGSLLQTAIENLKLRAGGHSFMLGADGLMLDEDMIIRENKRLTAFGADLAKGGGNVANGTVALNWYYVFGRVLRADGPARPNDCGIPLYLFDEKCDAESGFEFTVADAPKSHGGQTANFPGVTFDGFQSADLRVFALVRYEDEIISDMAWSLRDANFSDLNGKQTFGDLMHYAVVRDRVGTTNWTPSHDDYSGIHSFAGDEEILNGRSSLEVALMGNMVTGLGDDGPQAGNGPRVLTPTDPEWLPLVWCPPSARRLDMPRGTLVFQFDGRTDHTRTRIIGRGYSVNPNGYRDKLREFAPAPIKEASPDAQQPSPKAAQNMLILPTKLRTRGK